MSATDRIQCSQCGEVIRLTEERCPNCGKGIRSDNPFYIVIAVGIVLFIAMLFNPSYLLIFGILGLILALGGGAFIWEKRQRIKHASLGSE